MTKYLTEFIGTFFLVLTITLAVITNQALAPLAIGAALLGMIYMGGHISGAHYNPAVTVAAVMRGALPSSEALPYIGAQLAGGLIAALLGNFIAGGSVPIAPGADYGVVQALLVELLYTFMLVLTILNVATAKTTEGNQYFGLAIAFVVVGGAIAGGSISGGAFNPAVGIALSVGAMLAGTGGSSIWIYIVAPLAGGALAAVAFKAQGNE